MQAAGIDTSLCSEAPLGPADVEGLFRVLTAALSNAAETRSQAEEALLTMEGRLGFCSCLLVRPFPRKFSDRQFYLQGSMIVATVDAFMANQLLLERCLSHRSKLGTAGLEIVSAVNAEHSARWLASVHLKNMVNRYWRPRRNSSGISVEEKHHLRLQLLKTISQENNQIAVQVAVIFAKIARHDFPSEWPTLFPDLLGLLQSGDLLMNRRVYLVFHHILKELSSKRLTADQKNFAEITNKMIAHVWSNWCSDTQILLNGLPTAIGNPGAEPDRNLLLHFERWLLLLKALRRLILFGFRNDAKSAMPCNEVLELLPHLLQALQSLLPLRPVQRQVLSKTLAMLDRGLLKILKTLLDIQEAHPWAYHQSGILIPSMTLLCDTLVSAYRGSNSLPNRFLIRCILFVNQVTTSSTYRCSDSTLTVFPPNAQEAAMAMSQEVKSALTAFWLRDNRLHVVATSLVERFLPLTQAELTEWSENPEVFVSENDSGAWQEQLRGSAETLLLALLEEIGIQANRDSLAPTLVNMLRAANDACPAGSISTLASQGPMVSGIPSVVLLKEAVYNAVGVGAFELYDYIQFDQWFANALAMEVADKCHAAKPLRRRAILMLGCWVSKLGNQRSTAYQMLGTALADSDIVIKLAGVETLRALVDDWDFHEEPFLEYMPGCMQHLTSFLGDAAEQETQLKVFGLMSLIVERLGESIKPYSSGILSLLPGVWEQSEGNTMLRIQVMIVVQTLVNILGKESPSAYGIVLPLLAVVTDVNNPEELNLLEDGLALWLVSLRNSTEPHPGLLQIFPNLQSIMAQSTEHIRVVCQIMVSAILLGGLPFFQQYAFVILSIVAGALGNVTERGMLLLLPVIETAITLFPEEVPVTFEPALAKLLVLLLAGSESTTVVAAACGIYARLLLNKPEAWLSYFDRYASQVSVPGDAQQAETPGQTLMLAFLDKWLSQLDAIAQPAARKLSGLALCQLLRVQHIGILTRFDSIMAAVTGLWCEVEGGVDDGSRIVYGYDYYTVISGSYPDEAEASVRSEEAEAESLRKKHLHEVDPVNSLKLSMVLKRNLGVCSAIHGDNFMKAWQAMDGAVAQQAQSIVNKSVA